MQLNPNNARVNKVAYKRASLAARQYARNKGISPIKTTKALSEATRNMIDWEDYKGTHGTSNISRGLNGLTDRLTTGNRGGRTTRGGNYFTAKGSMTESFGKYMANEFIDPNSYPVLRPKPSRGTVVAGRDAAKAVSKIAKIF